MSSPLVSVIVPTHNRVNFLKETLFSILNQTFSDFELIVVSDGSNDGTDEMVSKIKDSRVSLIQQNKSGQPAKPRNRGISVSKGKYVALCDDDDIWEPNKLEVQVKTMEGSPLIDMSYTNGRVLKNGILFEAALNRRKVFNNHFNELLYGNFIPNSSVLIRRTVFDKIGLINTTDNLRGIEDYEFWLRIAHKCKLEYIDLPLIQYRVHANNITFSRSFETARAIIVVNHIKKSTNIPKALLIRIIAVQYSKYLIYKLIDR
jgi:glycosyltransferase involved in cell wall biosynthesis